MKIKICTAFHVKNLCFRIFYVTHAIHSGLVACSLPTSVCITGITPEGEIHSSDLFNLFFTKEISGDKLLTLYVFQETVHRFFFIYCKGDHQIRLIFSGKFSLKNYRIVTIIAKGGCSSSIRYDLCATAGASIYHCSLGICMGSVGGSCTIGNIGSSRGLSVIRLVCIGLLFRTS